jgi:hypothetical protein
MNCVYVLFQVHLAQPSGQLQVRLWPLVLLHPSPYLQKSCSMIHNCSGCRFLHAILFSLQAEAAVLHCTRATAFFCRFICKSIRSVLPCVLYPFNAVTSFTLFQMLHRFKALRLRWDVANVDFRVMYVVV